MLHHRFPFWLQRPSDNTMVFWLCGSLRRLVSLQVSALIDYECVYVCVCVRAYVCVCDDGCLPLGSLSVTLPCGGSRYCLVVFCTARRALVLCWRFAIYKCFICIIIMTLCSQCSTWLIDNHLYCVHVRVMILITLLAIIYMMDVEWLKQCVW